MGFCGRKWFKQQAYGHRKECIRRRIFTSIGCEEPRVHSLQMALFRRSRRSLPRFTQPIGLHHHLSAQNGRALGRKSSRHQPRRRARPKTFGQDLLQGRHLRLRQTRPDHNIRKIDQVRGIKQNRPTGRQLRHLQHLGT